MCVFVCGQEVVLGQSKYNLGNGIYFSLVGNSELFLYIHPSQTRCCTVQYGSIARGHKWIFKIIVE